MRNIVPAFGLIVLGSSALAHTYGESAFSEIMESARAAGIDHAHVTLTYEIDELCRPEVVEFIESEPKEFFDDAIRQNLGGESSIIHHDWPAPVEKLIDVIPLKDQRRAIIRSVRIDLENKHWLRCLILDDRRLKAWINETDELTWDYEENINPEELDVDTLTMEFDMKLRDE